MNEFLRYFAPTGGRTPFAIKLAGETFPDSEYAIERGEAKVAVLEYVLSGRGFVEWQGREVPVKSGDVYLLHQKTAHHYRSDPRDPFRKIFFNVSGPLCETLLSGYGLSEQPVYPGAEVKELFLLAREKMESDLPEAALQAALQGIFVEILSRLSLAGESAAHSTEAMEMKTFLDANTHRLISAEELSACIYRSPDYCRKLFLREFGITPYAYHLEQKLRKAKVLLSDTTLSVGEIAASLGYGDLHYFSNLFFQKFGVRPLRYRKEKQGK